MKAKNYFLIFASVLGLLILMYFFRSKAIACGLKNRHNVCYINSVIQSLFSCKSFIKIVEGKDAVPGSILFHLKKTWEEMKKKDILDKRPLYKKLASESGSLFQYDNKPGYTENFLEFLVMGLEKDVDSNLFLSEQNYNFENQEKVFLKKTERHMVLLSRNFQNYDDYIPSIESYLTEKKFTLSKIIVISFGPIYPKKPDIKIPISLKIQNFEYQLQSMICRKRKLLKKGHFFTYSKRDTLWFKLNDEVVTQIDNLDFLFTNEAYMLFYEQKL